MLSAVRRTAALLLAFLLVFHLPALASEYDPNDPGKLTSAQLKGQSVLVIAAGSGEVLFEKNADDVRFPASTTKIMTVLLGLMMGQPEDIVTVSAAAVTQPEDASTIPLVEGEQLRLDELIRMTMVSSGNDGAVAIAEHISGSEQAFVALMNDAARSFGCTHTNFTNAHGYHDDNHYTTARDLALIMKAALEVPEFREVAGLTTFTLPRSQWSGARKKSARSAALMVQGEENKYYYPFVTGGKTGFTNAAGYCFVGVGYKDGIELISVTLKAPNYGGCWVDTARLMGYGFSQFISTSVEALYRKQPKSVDISQYALDDPDLGKLELNIRKLDPLADDHLIGRAGEPDSWKASYSSRTNISFTRPLEAPIEAGEVLGVMTYTPEGAEKLPVEYELTAARSIARRESAAPSIDEIRQYSEADPNPFPRFSFEFLLIVLLPLIAVIALSQLFYRLFTRKRKPRISRRAGYETRHYR